VVLAAQLGTCNDPEKSPKLEFFVLFLFHVIVTSSIIMHLSSCIFLSNLKLFGLNSILIFARMVLLKYLLSLFLFKIKT
jgi:hypothetical protein